MDQLRRQVAIARRRLLLQQFIGVLFGCWFATFVAATIAIVIQKWLLGEIDDGVWAWCWLGGAIGAGLIAALVWMFSWRLPDVVAAIEIDHRFNLQERISSALALSHEELETPFGQALVEDAQRRLGKLQIAQRFPMRLNRHSWLPLFPAAVALVLCFLGGPGEPNSRTANAHAVTISKHINDAASPLQKKLQQRVQQASDKNLPQMEQLLKKVADEMRELTKKDDTDRHEALSKLNDISKQLEQRRDKLADGEKLKQELAALKNLPAGPADKLAQDIKNGKLEQALKELEKLQAQLAQGKLDPQQQKELTEQLQAMKDALTKSADAHQKMLTELQKQLEKAQQAGDQQTAKSLQAQINKLQVQEPQMALMKGIAAQLQKAADGMQKGDMKQAQNSLNQLAGELDKMQQELVEMQMLTSTLDDLEDAKFATGDQNKDKDGGGGHEFDLNNPMESNQGIGHEPGGEGKRPDPLHDPKLYDSRVRQNVAKGSVVVTGTIDGPNAKGQALEVIKGEVEAAKHDSSDPLTDQRLPRSHRDHVQQYFDAFRKGH